MKRSRDSKVHEAEYGQQRTPGGRRPQGYQTPHSGGVHERTGKSQYDGVAGRMMHRSPPQSARHTWLRGQPKEAYRSRWHRRSPSSQRKAWHDNHSASQNDRGRSGRSHQHPRRRRRNRKPRRNREEPVDDAKGKESRSRGQLSKRNHRHHRHRSHHYHSRSKSQGQSHSRSRSRSHNHHRNNLLKYSKEHDHEHDDDRENRHYRQQKRGRLNHDGHVASNKGDMRRKGRRRRDRRHHNRERRRRRAARALERRRAAKDLGNRTEWPDHKDSRRSELLSPSEGSGYESSDAGQSDEEDSRTHINCEPGDRLGPRHASFQVLHRVGCGTFGKVFACSVPAKWQPSWYRRGMSINVVAIKVVRKVRRYTESAVEEANIMRRLNRIMDDEALRPDGVEGALKIARLSETFYHAAHYCMVLEQLGPSLYDFSRAQHYTPFDNNTVLSIAFQLIAALDFLHNDCRCVHTDLKLENILFEARRIDFFGSTEMDTSNLPSSPSNGEVSSNRRRRRRIHVVNPMIKIIDFGGATFEKDHHTGTINTRQYRGPEVILGLGWDYPSDMWSLGCILAELLKGRLLFETHDSNEHLALMERFAGTFPNWMVNLSRNKSGDRYFGRDMQLSYPKSHHDRESQEHVRSMKPLQECAAESWQSSPELVSLLTGLLQLDPAMRLSARSARETYKVHGNSFANE